MELYGPDGEAAAVALKPAIKADQADPGYSSYVPPAAHLGPARGRARGRAVGRSYRGEIALCGDAPPMSPIGNIAILSARGHARRSGGPI